MMDEPIPGVAAVIDDAVSRCDGLFWRKVERLARDDAGAVSGRIELVTLAKVAWCG